MYFHTYLICLNYCLSFYRCFCFTLSKAVALNSKTSSYKDLYSKDIWYVNLKQMLHLLNRHWDYLPLQQQYINCKHNKDITAGEFIWHSLSILLVHNVLEITFAHNLFLFFLEMREINIPAKKRNNFIWLSNNNVIWTIKRFIINYCICFTLHQYSSRSLQHLSSLICTALL